MSRRVKNRDPNKEPPLQPKQKCPAPNRSAASLKTAFVGGERTRVPQDKKAR